MIACPMCSEFASVSVDAVQTHLDLVHFGLEDQSLVQQSQPLRCPLCPMSFADARLLEEHVDACLDGDKSESSGNKRGNAFVRQGTRHLESQVRRGHIDVVQYHNRVAEMRRNEHHGMDSQYTMTSGILPLLSSSSSTTFYLASDTCHFASSPSDMGWGCGYRNLQMLFSSLKNNSRFSTNLASVVENWPPSITRLQSMIEQAWSAGFDQMGARQLGNKLVGTNKWIGATEWAALLLYLGFKAKIVDFHRPTGPRGEHDELAKFVVNHFKHNHDSFVPPLLLQHSGHSRTIVGVKEGPRSSLQLVIFDPSNINAAKMARGLITTKSLLKSTCVLKQHRQYQIVVVEGVMVTREEREGSKVLSSMRIP